jgi:hypothetical protein
MSQQLSFAKAVVELFQMQAQSLEIDHHPPFYFAGNAVMS